MCNHLNNDFRLTNSFVFRLRFLGSYNTLDRVFHIYSHSQHSHVAIQSSLGDTSTHVEGGRWDRGPAFSWCSRYYVGCNKESIYLLNETNNRAKRDKSFLCFSFFLSLYHHLVEQQEKVYRAHTRRVLVYHQPSFNEFVPGVGAGWVLYPIGHSYRYVTSIH